MTDSIYVTLGAAQLKEKPYREQIKDFLKCDGENFFFNWAINNKPKKDFIWVYIVVGNKVRWRARFIGYDEDNPDKTFSDGRRWKSTIWLLLIDFEKLRAPYKNMKGFQGFRYKNDN